MVRVRTSLDEVAPRAARGGAVLVSGPVVAKQEFKDESDINVIMSRYVKYGTLPPMGGSAGTFSDVSTVEDLLSAQLLVKEAEARFASLDSRVRERFRNDPLELLRFLGDESNRKEAEDLGLVEKKLVVPVAGAGAAPAGAVQAVSVAAPVAAPGVEKRD